MNSNFISLFLLLSIGISHSQKQQLDYTWGSKKNVFDKNELNLIAASVSKIDMMHYNLTKNHNFYCRDSVDITSSSLQERNESWKRNIENNYASFGYGSNPDFKIQSSVIENINYWPEKFIVFLCENNETVLNKNDNSTLISIDSNPQYRIVAVDYDGVFYFLGGFAKDDFYQLIKSNIEIPIKNSDIALKIILLYLNTIKYSQFIDYIDLNNIDTYTTQGVNEPSVVSSNNSFLVEVYSIDRITDTIIKHTCILKQSGEIEYKFNCIKNCEN